MINFALKILLRIEANINPSHIVKRENVEEDALVKKSFDTIEKFNKIVS